MNANIRSIVSKTDELTYYLSSNNISVAALTETWLKDTMATEFFEIDGYSMIRNDRNGRRGGGVAVYIKNSLSYKHWSQLEEEDQETLWITLRPRLMPQTFSCMLVGIIYHPPNANNWKLSNHISNAIDRVLQHHPDAGLLLMGDFNSFKASYITSSYNLKQIVTHPTRKNKILDKIYTNMCTI